MKPFIKFVMKNEFLSTQGQKTTFRMHSKILANDRCYGDSLPKQERTVHKNINDVQKTFVFNSEWISCQKMV